MLNEPPAFEDRDKLAANVDYLRLSDEEKADLASAVIGKDTANWATLTYTETNLLIAAFEGFFNLQKILL